MSSVTPEPLPLGDAALVAVDRALGELRRGRVIAVGEGAQGAWRLVAPLETAESVLIAHLLAAPYGAQLALTAERATALGVSSVVGADAVMLGLPQDIDATRLHELGQHWEVEGWRDILRTTLPQGKPADALTLAAVSLCKLAQLLPALLVSSLRRDAIPSQVLAVTVAQIARHDAPLAVDLLRVSEAQVPLRNDHNSRFVVFRDRRDATEHVAVIVGSPDATSIVTTRVHSSCFTGDLMGSLRCDCGEQLQNAVKRLHDVGGGVLLYLAQEGRGIGLANKLRAYQLQDDGLDTVDANRHLGFSDDERDYAIAAAMLRQLGYTRIRLLTNSPHKLRELREQGIDVVDIETLPGTPNEHNARYIQTKHDRAGHFAPDYKTGQSK
jgi:GTP cyclohydrolase II